MKKLTQARLRNTDPFLARVTGIIASSVETECEAEPGRSPLRLTAETLARRLDNISLAKLRRELEKLGAPPPGELIRKARLAHAAKLLTHTRLMVQQIADRSGYRSKKQFTDAFKAEFNTTPSDYRRKFINSQCAEP